MRSVERRLDLHRTLGLSALVLLCAGLGGCASMSSMASSVGSVFKSIPLGGPAVAETPAASTPAPASAAAAAAKAAPTPAIASPAERAAAAERAGTAPAAGASTLIAAPVSSVPSSSAPAQAPQRAAREPDAPVAPAVQRAYDDARRLMRAGNAAEAERGFRALTQAHPDLGGPHAQLGVLLRQGGKLPEAVAEGEKAVKANPKQAAYFNQLGISYRQNGQFAKAREAYENAIDLDPAYASPLLNLGILHDLYLADGKRALELYDRYLALLPGGDATVSKWVADLKNRKPQPTTVSQTLGQKEKE